MGVGKEGFLGIGSCDCGDWQFETFRTSQRVKQGRVDIVSFWRLFGVRIFFFFLIS